MDQSSIQAVRARARKLYEDGNDEERMVLDLLLAAVDDEEAGRTEADATDVEGFTIRSRSNLGATVLRSFQSQDKLGNFEIQDLMSQYNQAETLASSVLKKRDDTGNAVIGKI